MIHEIGHMFGLYDCSYYTCIMNGSNHKNDYAGKRAIGTLEYIYIYIYRFLPCLFEKITIYSKV